MVEELTPDLSRIRPYTPEDDQIWKPTAITRFSKGKKDLFYINASHESGTNNPTCETIRQAIERYQPQLVVIEGVPSSAGTTPDFFIDEINKQEQAGFKNGEVVYTAHLAHKNNIPFIGGEPTDGEIINSMQQQGYSAKDVMAFYLLRAIPMAHTIKDPINAQNFEQRAQEYLSKFFPYIPSEERLTVGEFKQWYEAHKPNDKHYLEISNNDLAPFSHAGATYFQKMQADISEVRERNIDTTIAQALQNNDKVLVVYGGAHLTKSQDVFEDMLSKGEKIQVVPDEEQKKHQQQKTALQQARLVAEEAGLLRGPHDKAEPNTALPPSRNLSTQIG